MIGIDEAHVARTQQVFVDEHARIGSHSQVFPLVVAFVLGMLHAHDYILDSDAELSIFIKTWFVRGAHTLNPLLFVATADTVWTFVDA